MDVIGSSVINLISNIFKCEQSGGTHQKRIKDLSEQLVDLRIKLREKKNEYDKLSKEIEDDYIKKVEFANGPNTLSVNEQARYIEEGEGERRIGKEKLGSSTGRDIGTLERHIGEITRLIHNLKYPDRFQTISGADIDYTKPYTTDSLKMYEILFEHEKMLEKLNDKEKLHDTLIVTSDEHNKHFMDQINTKIDVIERRLNELFHNQDVIIDSIKLGKSKRHGKLRELHFREHI